MKTGKRFLSLLLAVIIAVSGICAVNIAIASAADYTSASTLLSGIATTGSLTETGVKNWYRFTAPASSTEITFTHDAKSDTGAYFTGSEKYFSGISEFSPSSRKSQFSETGRYRFRVWRRALAM